MGSPLSFIVLCLAHLGLYLRARAGDKFDANATERAHTRTVQRWMRDVLINGDDGLFVADETMMKAFSFYGSAIGLTLSVGKAYWHSIYANINSVSYHYDLEDANSTPWKVGYLNTGLLFGQHKVLSRIGEGEDELEEKVGTLLSVVPTLLEGASGIRREAELLALFLALHADEVRAEQDKRNLFLPLSYGGCGLLRPIGFRARVTPAQFQLVQEIDQVKRIDVRGYGRRLESAQRPLLADEIIGSMPFRPPWSARDAAKKFARRFLGNTSTFPTHESYCRYKSMTKRQWTSWENRHSHGLILVRPLAEHSTTA